MMNVHASRILLVLLAVLAVQCGHSGPVASGNGSRTGNPAVAGVLRLENGSPAVGAVVSIVPVDYVPSISLFKLMRAAPVSCTTGADGSYRVSIPDTGLYNIEAILDTLGTLKPSLQILSDSMDFNISDLVLHRLGSISGVTKMPGKSDTNQVRVTLYMPGTRHITKPVIGGAFQFDAMPAGTYQLIIDPTYDTYNVKVLDITLATGQRLDLDTISLELYQPDTIEIRESTATGIWGPGRVYNVQNSFVIPSGARLTILPGTKVRVFGAINIWALGDLIVKGTPDSLIIIEQVYPGISSGFFLGDPNSQKTDTAQIWQWAIFNGFQGMYLNRPVKISNCAILNSYTGIAINYLQNGIVPISNCLFWKNRNALFPYGTSGFSITNSIFMGNDSIYAYDNSISSIPTFNFCAFFNNGALPDSQIISNSLFADPLLLSLDTTAFDFHLKSGSPCRSAGLNGKDIGMYDTSDYQIK